MTPEESSYSYQDPGGYKLDLQEIILDEFSLKWGSYINPSEKLLVFHPKKKSIVSHFLLRESKKKDAPGEPMRENQFVVYREAPESYELLTAPTGNGPRTFFELSFSEAFFNDLFTEESRFLTSFSNYKAQNTPSAAFTTRMAPVMFQMIEQIKRSPYKGHLAARYLEAKAMELFLQQISQLDQQANSVTNKLSPRDIEALHAIKEYMLHHYDEDCTILKLARIGAINQMKLKTGFKLLFGSTVFAYLTDIRMSKARELLLDGKNQVADVAEIIGYKHPHHFAAAFKRKYGITPSQLLD